MVACHNPSQTIVCCLAACRNPSAPRVCHMAACRNPSAPRVCRLAACHFPPPKLEVGTQLCRLDACHFPPYHMQEPFTRIPNLVLTKKWRLAPMLEIPRTRQNSTYYQLSLSYPCHKLFNKYLVD